LFVAALVVAVGQAVVFAKPPAAALTQPTEVVSLDGSLRPIQERFAESAAGPHFVALLSPT
jgi:hypothetical protein